MEKFIISAAITGGMTVPGQSEAIPITPDEIIDSAVGAHEAGATIVHLHVREPETGNPSSEMELFREVVAEIKERCDVIVQPTTGGGKGMTLEERAAVLPELEPEMATFNTGSFNFALFPIAERGGDFEEWEIDYLLGRDLLDTPVHIQFVLGVMGANAATIEQLMHMRRTATDLFGEDYTWSAAGVGYPAEYHLAAMCLMLGGHVRVGLEDNLRVSSE